MNMPQKIDEEDFQLSVEQLDDKYNPEGDGEHPVFTRWDWTQVVAQRSTLSGYWEWVVDQLDKAYSEYCRNTPKTHMTNLEALAAAHGATTPGKWEAWPAVNDDDPSPFRIDVTGAHPSGGDLVAAWVSRQQDAAFIELAHRLTPLLLQAAAYLGIAVASNGLPPNGVDKARDILKQLQDVADEGKIV